MEAVHSLKSIALRCSTASIVQLFSNAITSELAYVSLSATKVKTRVMALWSHWQPSYEVHANVLDQGLPRYWSSHVVMIDPLGCLPLLHWLVPRQSGIPVLRNLGDCAAQSENPQNAQAICRLRKDIFLPTIGSQDQLHSCVKRGQYTPNKEERFQLFALAKILWRKLLEWLDHDAVVLAALTHIDWEVS